MTAQQWVGLGVRLFALWLFITALQYIVLIPDAISRSGVEGNGFLSYLFGAVYLVLAVTLWMFPMTIAHRLIPKSYDTVPLRPAAFDTARVGVALFGLWLLVQYALPLVMFIFNVIFFAGSGSYFGALTSEQRVQTLVYVAGAVMALFLLFRSSAVATIMLRVEAPRADIDSRNSGQ